MRHGLDLVPEVDDEGNYTSRLGLRLTPSGTLNGNNDDIVIYLVVPPPPDDWRMTDWT